MPLSILLIVLLLSCLLSFTWAMKNFFTQPAGENGGMRVIKALGTLFGALHFSMILWHPAEQSLALAGAMLYCASLATFWWALMTHCRRPLSAAFSPDVPSRLVRNGPYRFVRHPFYTSYLLVWFAGPIASGTWWMLATTVVMAAVYYRAARIEERKFIVSDLANAYADYRSRTGMFIPSPLKLALVAIRSTTRSQPNTARQPID
jgi:protein-S-isoprenylcysteine O-methyltransferase Ste14